MGEEEIAVNKKRLEEEWKLLTNRWDDWDRRAMGVKAWIGAGAVVLFVYLGGKDGLHPLAVIAIIVVILSFWVLDALIKTTQHEFGSRLNELEKAFLSLDAAVIPPFQTKQRWTEEYTSKFPGLPEEPKTFYDLVKRLPAEWRRIQIEMGRIGCCLPYFPLIAMMTLYVLYKLLSYLAC